MAGAKREPTGHPGIYRRGTGYSYIWRDSHGRQRSGSARTLTDARKAKTRMEAEASTGTPHDAQRVTLAEYAEAWVARYQGHGRHTFRPNTRREYARDVARYVVPFFGSRLRVVELGPKSVSDFIAWLCSEDEQRERHQREAIERKRQGLRALRSPSLPLADGTVRRIVAVLRVCMATAMREGLIRSNPVTGSALPNRPRLDDDGDDDADDVRALSAEQLDVFLNHVPGDDRLLLWLLAETGMRISEALALRWRDVRLEQGDSSVRVRRAVVKGEVGPPKSIHGRRRVPISEAVARELLRWRVVSAWREPEHLIFPTPGGTFIEQTNLRRRALLPAAQEAGITRPGFHLLRHTFASLHIARGTNVVQLSRLMGHHSPSVTLGIYTHLLDGDVGGPLGVKAPPPIHRASGGSIGAASSGQPEPGSIFPDAPPAEW